MPASQQPCCRNHLCPSPGGQVRLRGGMTAQALPSAPASPPILSLRPSPWGVLGGEGPADSLTPAPLEGLSFRVLWPRKNPEVLGVCDSATPAVLHHPVYSPPSVHARPRSSHRTCIPTDPHPCRSKGAPLGQGRTSALFSPITVPRPHLRVLIHGSVRDNTAVCICFLNFCITRTMGLMESSGTLEFKVPGS